MCVFSMFFSYSLINMLVNPSRILKTVYKTLLLGIPQILYNPLRDTNLIVPLQVNEVSTYVNFNLKPCDVCELTQYIHKYNKSLELVPIKLFNDDKEDYYLSINIYNSTSPIFLTDDPVTRCELNTYIKDKNGNYGTLIIDYITNGQSMDPISLIKLPEWEKKCSFVKSGSLCNITCVSPLHKLDMSLDFDLQDPSVVACQLSDELIKYTDNIFYKDGILDKLYYDESLVNAETYKINADVSFSFRDLGLGSGSGVDSCACDGCACDGGACDGGACDGGGGDGDVRPHSVFFFKNKINFVGSMWHNLYKIRRHKPAIRDLM